MNGLISTSDASVSIKALYRLWKNATACVDLRRLQSQRKSQLARLPRAKPNRRIDRLLEDGLGSLRRNLFNLHAAGLRRHKHQLARGAVQHDAEIKLALNGRGLFNQQPLHLLSLRPGLVRHQRHAQNVLRVQLGVLARLGHLHAAAFAAASCVNLRLHHHARSAFGKQLARYRRTASSSVFAIFAFGHGNAVLRQDFLCLILVNFQMG